jgi:hypothetical protein
MSNLRRILCVLSLGFALLTWASNEARAETTLAVADPFRNYQSVGAGVNVLKVQKRILIGESEGYFFWINDAQNNELIVDYQQTPGPNYQAQVYQPMRVELKKGSKTLDALKPIPPKDSIRIDGRALLYLKVTTSGNAKPGAAEFAMTIRGRDGKELARLQMDLFVSSVALPSELPVMLQGTISLQKDWADLVQPQARERFKPASMVRSIQAFLKEYRFNALAGMSAGGLIDDRTYEELVINALDRLGYRRVRLASRYMYSWANPLPPKWHMDQGMRRNSLEDIRKNMGRWQELTTKEAYKGRLSLKLWDEPRKQDLENVISMYKSVKESMPGLMLEISDAPIEELDKTVKTWVPSFRRLRKLPLPQTIEREHALGNEVWFYANPLHNIDSPYGSMRYIGWVIWRYNLNGYHVWSVNKWDSNPLLPSNELRSGGKREKESKEDKDESQSSGLLLYPDPKDGSILPSIRLEALRDGIEDLLLLHVFERRVQAAGRPDQKALNLLQEAKTQGNLDQDFKNAAALPDLRNRMIDILESK